MATINVGNLPTQALTPATQAEQVQGTSGQAMSSEDARALLKDIAVKITTGGTVQTGYLSLQKGADGSYTVENRSRFNVFGDKAAAAALIKNLIHSAYGDEIGAQSTQALEQQIDAYLGSKFFGSKLGTVSYVRLVNTLEASTGANGQRVNDTKSSLDSLLGAGGSMAIDKQSIADGAGRVRAMESQLKTLTDDSRSLTAGDTSDCVPAVLSQLSQNTEMLARVREEHADNGKLSKLGDTLAALSEQMVTQLNNDVCDRVDTLRLPGDNQLDAQIQQLGALKAQITDLSGQPHGPVSGGSVQKLENALGAAEGRSQSIKAIQQTGAMRLEQTEALTNQNTANAIPDVLTTLDALAELDAEITALRTDNHELAQLTSALGSSGEALASKLNNDVCDRVDNIRSTGNKDLSQQIRQLRELKASVATATEQPGAVITETTQQKIDDALASAIDASERLIARDGAEARLAASLIKETSHRLGIRLGTPGQQSTSRFNQTDIAWAFEQHQTITAALSNLQSAAELAGNGNTKAELFGQTQALQAILTTLETRIKSDIAAITKQEAQHGNSGAIIDRAASLSKLDACIKQAAARGLTIINPELASRVSETLDNVLANAVVAMESGALQERLDSVVPNPNATAPALARQSIELNDFLEQTVDVLKHVSPGTQTQQVQKLQQDLALRAYDTLNQLKNTLALPGTEPRPNRVSGSPEEAVRGQAMANLENQAKRLQTLTSGAGAPEGLTLQIQGLVAELPALREAEALSMLLDWAPADSSKPRMPPGLGAAIEASPNAAALKQSIVTLYERGLFQLGDPLMSKLAAVLGPGGGTQMSASSADARGIDLVQQARVDHRSLVWLTELAQGDPAAVNSLLNEAQWDDTALALKKLAPGAEAPKQQAQIERDHSIHLAKRTLDELLRAANPSWGTGGGLSFNPLTPTGMQGLRFDASTVEALLNASEKSLPSNGMVQSFKDLMFGPQKIIDVSSMELMLAYLIAMETAREDGSEGASVDAKQQEAAKSVLLQLSFIKNAGMTAATPAADILAKALEWGGGTQTTAKGLLHAADQIKAVSNKLAANSAALLAGLKQYDAAREPIKVKAEEQHLRLKAHLFALNKTSGLLKGAQFETQQVLFERLARPLQANLTNSNAVTKFVEGLRKTQDLAFETRVDLNDVRDMAARLVSEKSTNRLVGGGIVEHLFGLKSANLRKPTQGANVPLDITIRNNLAKAPLAKHLLSDPRGSSATRDRFKGLAEAVRGGAGSEQVRNNLPGPDADISLWLEFVNARQGDYGPRARAGALGTLGALTGLASETTKARGFLNNLWEDLVVAVNEANAADNPSAAQMRTLNTLADRYLALVEIGERQQDVADAISGLEKGRQLRNDAAAAVKQIREANPEAQRVVMLMMLDLFQSTGLGNLNDFRSEILKPGTDTELSGLAQQLSDRFTQIGLEQIGGTEAINFCKALLVSTENANSLLDDHPQGWSGKVGDLVSSKLGIERGIAPPKAVKNFVARDELANALQNRLGQLLPGQSFEVRLTQSGEVEFTIPTTLPGVDATAGLALSRDNSVTVRKEDDNRFSVVGKYSYQAGISGGISAFGEALSLAAGVDAGTGSGFMVTMDSLQGAQDFMQHLFNTDSARPAQQAQFLDAAARASVLSNKGMGIGVEATLKAEPMTPGVLGLSLGLEIRLDASARASREYSTEQSGIQHIQTNRVNYQWAASGNVQLGAAVLDPPDLGLEPPFANEAEEVAESAEDEGPEMSGLPLEASAAMARAEFDEQQIVTRRGVVHQSTSLKRGFLDQPGRLSGSLIGTVATEQPLLKQRIAALLEGTGLEGQLSQKGALASAVDRLLSIAQQKPYEISLTSTLKPTVALHIAELQKGGKSSDIKEMLKDKANYQPATLELVYTESARANPVNPSSIEDPEEQEIPGIEGILVSGSYSKKAAAELSTRESINLANF